MHAVALSMHSRSVLLLEATDQHQNMCFACECLFQFLE